jgi:hypothetical protein
MAVFSLSYLLFVAALFTLCTGFDFKNGRPTVTIDSGVILGNNATENSSSTPLTTWFGIPFASPVSLPPVISLYWAVSEVVAGSSVLEVASLPVSERCFA